MAQAFVTTLRTLLERLCDKPMQNIELGQGSCCARHVRRASAFSRHVMARVDGREEIALEKKRIASCEGGGPSLQTAPIVQGVVNYTR